MARKGEQEDVEQQDDDDQDLEGDQGVSINITEDTITIDLPRDGNEGETLSQLSKMVEGMSQ
jgi:hypothetical protein